MIVRLNGAKSNGMGRGFKGAGQYHLHDKNAQTQERIGETETINLAIKDPETALHVMAATSMNQKDIKESAGVKNTGRKLATPVFTYSLSWHKDDNPTAEHMIEQAKATLVVLGLENKQAVIIEHLDTEHKHVHVIVNRVDPENGIASNLSYSKKDLSRWAREYEQDNIIRCEGRFKKEKQVEAIKEEDIAVNAQIILPESQGLPQELPQKMPESLVAEADAVEEYSKEPRVQEFIQSAKDWIKDKVFSAYYYLSRQQESEQQKEQPQPQQEENTR